MVPGGLEAQDLSLPSTLKYFPSFHSRYYTQNSRAISLEHQLLCIPTGIHSAPHCVHVGEVHMEYDGHMYSEYSTRNRWRTLSFPYRGRAYLITDHHDHEITRSRAMRLRTVTDDHQAYLHFIWQSLSSEVSRESEESEVQRKEILDFIGAWTLAIRTTTAQSISSCW